MSKSDEQWLFLKDVAKLIIYADDLGYKLTGGELYRTEEQQRIYVEEGKSQVTRSNHQDRLAIDLNLFVEGEIQWVKNEYWEALGKYWKAISPKNKWGGDYTSLKDPYHFQRDI